MSNAAQTQVWATLDTCADCVFFRPYTMEAYTLGDCRRYPPTLVCDQVLAKGKFPPISSGDWCGEFKKK